jgi:FlaA1/EpsC-like NDP-sugar epimerase
MGSTKRLAELLTIEAAMRTGMAYSAVRFGNVLGSSGSIVPLLERQLEDGLPLTITDPDATRYFMTLSEAVTLILQAGAAAAAGEVYVLDMGAPVRVGDLVSDLVHLHGMDRATVETRVTGLRPGEKLHEKLYFDVEKPEPTSHGGISRARWDPEARRPVWTADESLVMERAALVRDDVAVRRALSEAVPLIEKADVSSGR